MNVLKDQAKVFPTGNFGDINPKLLKYHGGWGDTFAMSTVGGNLGACGATTGSGCGGVCVAREVYTEEYLQDFLYFITKTLQRRTLYYLPVTYQMPYLTVPGSFLYMMQQIGAKEVHKSPNRIHGPNNMHLWVYDPGCPEALAAKEKLLVAVQTKDMYGYAATMHIPRHIWEADQAGKTAAPEVVAKPVPKSKVYIGEVKVRINPPKPGGPARDKDGRFTNRSI